jgi:lactaldehyde dehydrogenase/glycolaldehyde dehydrogenase
MRGRTNNTYKFYINAEHVDSSSHKTIDVRDPASEEVFASVPQGSAEDARRAITAAKTAQKKWAGLPAIERSGYLKKLAQKLRAHSEILGRVITKEQGKSISVATGEAVWGADLMEYHAGWARRIEGEIIQSDTIDENILLYKVPIGVVSCIIPWNFPLYVLIRKLSPALVTGNTVVLKPSSETPCSALKFARLLDDIDLPAGVVNIVTGRGAEVGTELSASPDVDLVTLTGSTAAGRQVMQACSGNITKCSLELGGKAPAIVMDDADLDLAVECIKASRISNAGQVCNCVERVYVQAAIADVFIDRITQAMRHVRMGNGMDDPEMGPLISKDALDGVHAMVQKAVADGAISACGGQPSRRFGKGFFYEPTVLVNCRQDMDIMREEIFGPVMPIMTFKSVDEVLALANDCKYGLTAALFTTSYRTAMRFANEIETGELYINRLPGEAYQGFHAGWKLSGIGGDDGKHGLDAYLRTRTVYMKY